MANHGYIPRDGKALSGWQIVRGLVNCYGLTTPFSIFLSYTTFLLLKKLGRRIDLYEIGEHGVVEHDASLVHRNTGTGEKYAPIDIDKDLLAKFVKEARTEVEVEVEVDGKKELETLNLLTIADVGRARVRREKESPPLDAKHAEIARGEVAIILGVWETKTKDVTGTRMDWLERWLGEERLPDGWKPARAVGMFETVRRAKAIRAATEAVRAAEAAKTD
ncbi:hypothetical protein DFP72DRAFT_990574 [Ephemerocybe angulata]|uniref:Heme haloperoxidase family profile domain-containing protein n=1 Tax=Ephemerocybe angulata TaxID=980116 RepID=A0A8H6M490_9AGAR|nr:hypothetical protein DFP72DRAFT_990574 [Tulosesus angulatus]